MRCQRRLSTTIVMTSIVAVAILGVLSGCGKSDDVKAGPDDTPLRKVRVVLDWTPNTNHAGMYLAQANGWYEAAGLAVSFVEPGDASNLQLLAAGQADVAVSVAEEVIPARAQGLPVQSIAAIIEHNTSSLVSLKADGIRRPKDLEGKTYAGWGGLLEKALIDTLVTCDGGDPSKVKFVDVGEADYRIGLERNQYDVVWIMDGWDGIRLTEVDKVPVSSLPLIDYDDCIPDWYTPVLASSDRMAEKRPADLTAFLAATSRGYQAAMTDPTAAVNALMKASPDLDRDLVSRSATYLATRYADDPTQWGQQSGEVWSSFSAFLTKAGLVKKPVAVAEVWTNEFLPEG